MKFKLFICSILFYSMAYGQAGCASFDSEQLNGLLGGTLYVVPSGDKDFDDSLVSSLKKYWKQTPFEVITKETMNSDMKGDTKYFITCFAYNFGKDVNIMSSPSEYQKEGYQHFSLKVFYGGKEYKKSMGIITSAEFPFGYYKYFALTTDYAVKELNDQIAMTISKKYNSSKDQGYMWTYRALFNINPQMLKEKTLIVPSALDNVFPEKLMVNAYKYKYKFMSNPDIIALLSSSDAVNYCFVPETGIEHIMVYDGASKSMIYSGPNKVAMNPKNINEKEVKELNTEIGKPVKDKK